MMTDVHSQERRSLTDLQVFPPTVVDHDTWKDGVTDLLLLDDGTEQEPRFIRVHPDEGLEGHNI